MSSRDDELEDADKESPRRVARGGGQQQDPARALGPSAGSRNLTDRAVTLVRDSPNWLSVIRSLQSTDVIVLLTPLVVPVSEDPEDTSDPFECFGRALEARHPRIRHQPYTNRNGITSTHVGFIKRAKVVIFVMNDATIAGATPQVDAAHVTRVLADESPLVIVLTSSAQDLLRLSEDFPTVIQSRDYTRPSLEMVAAIIFGEAERALPPPITSPPIPQHTRPRVWPVEQWDKLIDRESVADLWNRSMDRRFTMHATFFADLLDRPGWARHYIVKDPSRQHVLGFAATYLSYVDQAGEKLIASLAILLVRPEFQRQGIGLSLHNHALEQLKKTRGVGRLQLGSTFPRILYGPPYPMNFDHAWFSHRGWQTARDLPGQGRKVYDLLLDFNDWHSVDRPLNSAIQIRSCQKSDMNAVLRLVDNETARENNVGWFDQYSRLIDSHYVRDVVVAFEKSDVAGVALTYTPSEKSPVSDDLPWARQIGDDVGGITCICVPVSKRDELMLPLLDTCVNILRNKGLRRMFLDGVINQVEAFNQLGFREWAQYRDVWRDI